jgi:hypothetical protein
MHSYLNTNYRQLKNYSQVKAGANSIAKQTEATSALFTVRLTVRLTVAETACSFTKRS